MQYWWIIWIALLLWLFLQEKSHAAVVLHIRGKHSKQEAESMVELAKQFIGKECIITIITSSTGVVGTIEAVEEHGMLVKKDNVTTLVNLEYVSQIKEFPRKKNGKKKAKVSEIFE